MSKRTFGSDETGNIAVVTALSLSVILAAVGTAIDVAGATSHKASLQQQVDAAVLAAAAGSAMSSREGKKAKDSNGNKTGHIKKRVRDFVREDDDFKTAKVDVKVSDTTITATAESEYKTFLMGMFGKPTMKTSVSATVPRASNPPMDIALVLDTTDSMAGANMDALKDAALELINTLEDSKDPVRVSLVPYGDYVNIGLSRAGEPWLRSTKPDKPAGSYSRDIRKTITPRECIGTGVMITKPIYNDGVYVGDNTYEQQSCTPAVTEVTGSETVFYPATVYEWGGCAGSRPSPDNARPDASASDQIIGALHPVGQPDRVKCGQELIPLTDKWQSLRDGITAMTPSGTTYLPSGLMWGWRTLDARMPFTEGATNPNGMKAVIFMTDGGNVRSQKNEFHNGWDKNGGTTHAQDLCTGIKDAGITLYTVAYDLPAMNNLDIDPQAFLSECASSSGQAYSADNVFELKASFQSILRSMMDVRLTR